MFWDKVAWAYDIFADGLNKKTNRALCAEAAQLIRPEDTVLECACGTGLLTKAIAPRCKCLIATDFSEKMLRRAERKCKSFPNAEFLQADILRLPFATGAFDAVVAANVIHLLEDPYAALRELERVAKPGGRLILPTYLNRARQGKTDSLSRAVGIAGANFKRQFTPASYRRFFTKAGYPDAKYLFCDGRIPCAVAILQKK